MNSSTDTDIRNYRAADRSLVKRCRHLSRVARSPRNRRAAAPKAGPVAGATAVADWRLRKIAAEMKAGGKGLQAALTLQAVLSVVNGRRV